MTRTLAELYVKQGLIGKAREIYRRLSRMGDLVHAVAERVWYAVVKEA